MDIDVKLTNRELFIKFNGLTHFRIDRREIVGIQSWISDRRDCLLYMIQFYTKSSNQEIILQYDEKEYWMEILNQLDDLPILNEWKIDDP